MFTIVDTFESHSSGSSGGSLTAHRNKTDFVQSLGQLQVRKASKFMILLNLFSLGVSAD